MPGKRARPDRSCAIRFARSSSLTGRCGTRPAEIASRSAPSVVGAAIHHTNRSMIERLLSLTDVAAIAHRGGARLRPENTLAAFDHALSLGVDALECDVHLSRDGEPVVIHDPTLDRTTEASGPVAARTAAE